MLLRGKQVVYLIFHKHVVPPELLTIKKIFALTAVFLQYSDTVIFGFYFLPLSPFSLVFV